VLFVLHRLQVYSPSTAFSMFLFALPNAATGFGLMVLYGCYFLLA
jgi:hypothetical protein